MKLPLYVVAIGGNVSDAGIVLACFTLTAVIVRPWIGRLSDRRAKKAIMLAGAVVLAASSLLYEPVHSVPLLMAVRVFHGVGWAAFGTAASALAADLAPASRRGEAMGYFGVGMNVAMAIGPALGVFLVGRTGYGARPRDHRLDAPSAEALEDVPIGQLLRQLTEAAEGRSSVNVQLTVHGDEQPPPALHGPICRITQEALNNVTRHARAPKAWVDLNVAPDRVRLVVGDDGSGFEPSACDPTHLGLRSMRERAQQAGAQLDLVTERGRGTVITVEWRRT